MAHNKFNLYWSLWQYITRITLFNYNYRFVINYIYSQTETENQEIFINSDQSIHEFSQLRLYIGNNLLAICILTLSSCWLCFSPFPYILNKYSLILTLMLHCDNMPLSLVEMESQTSLHTTETTGTRWITKTQVTL